ncbi:proteasome activator complex subunit 4B [Cephus cinctus]|uniref:Proteasome activator complex subunit 4B n=1 Tax=Cephus cinctus TaxID=211228 RepID=A0AAJ7BKJ8_CEPCN|nr:proteasome activator complex subunit 4B [Cephus cinctus]
MDDENGQEIEDDVTMQSSTGSLGSQFQKEIIYNKLLPYAEELDEESQYYLAEIKGNLARAVMLREMQPGCTIWTASLCKYIKIYGLKFSKEDHILFIKLMYELITIPDLEPSLVHKFGCVLILLLKKKELISPDELELPWKPLFELGRRVTPSGKTALGMYRYFSCLVTTLDALVHAAKFYFPLSATQEILDELRPMLCPFNGNTISTTVEALEWFLPLHVPSNSIGYELWFNEFMNFWEVCHNAPQWENEMMWLISRLALYNIGYIDWEPHIPLMFTRFIRCLNLPVSYKQTQSSKHHKIEMPPIAIWIVSTLGNGSSTQTYLEKFLKTVETYLYPANFGRWLVKLKDLLKKLPYYFILRLHKERYAKPTWERPIPDTHKLTDSEIDAFVKSMIPVAMTAMFSRLGVIDVCQALHYLATVRPSLVIPDVLERMYSTFDSLTEPHKLTASMVCMVSVARPLVQGSRNIIKGYTFPEGPSHVLPLLFSSLPGIDPNDARKCFVTFRLISVYATLVPIVDSSRCTVPMSEDERMVCEATSRFEDFILQFLDRVFAFIDSSSLEFVRQESRGNDEKSKLETMVEDALQAVCTSLLVQTSDAIFNCALHKLRAFITERILETKIAGQLAAVLCYVFARVNGQATLRALVPTLSQTIFDAIDEGDDVIKEENLDKRLLYAMLLLSQMTNTPGRNLLPHINTLIKVLDKILYLKSREGSQIACRLLKFLLYALSTVTPVTFPSTGKEFNDPEYPYIRDWGKALDLNTLMVSDGKYQIKWYIPGEEEIAMIQQIFSKYLMPEVAKLEQYSANKISLTREELLSSLNVVNSIIGGCTSVLPMWKEPPIELMKSSLPWTPFLPTTGIKGEVQMPDGSNVRKYMARVMSNLQATMLKKSEDDTKSLFHMIHIWSSLFMDKERLRDSYEARRKSFQVAKKVLEDKLIGKKGRIASFVHERTDIQHESRLQSQSHCLTETHKLIMLELLTLATSTYAGIRIEAQTVLFSILQHYAYSYTFLIPRIVEILAMDPEENHDAHKGVLYLLLGPEQDPLLTKRDWPLVKILWPAIVTSKPSEKLSVIRLKEILVDSVHKHFPTTAIALEVPDSCVKIAAAFFETFPKPNVPQPTDKEIQEGLQSLKELGVRNKNLYYGVLNDLLSPIIEGNLHWRHRLMAMNFIRDLVHPDEVYPVKVVRYFLGALIHDSLDERKIAIRTVIYILKQQKRKHQKIKIDISKFQKKLSTNDKQIEKWTPGERPDNAWLQYDFDTRPVTEEQWNEPRFVHQPYLGYYAWPKEVEVYAPSSQQPCLDPKTRKLSEVESEVDRFFGDKQNVDKLVKFFSLEEKKGRDKFNGYRFLLFKGLFRNHGDAHLHHFLPHLQRLVADKHESNQRCAAEITAGLIRGAKHWPFQMTSNMWEVLLPIIRTTLTNLTVETVADWGVCFATSQERRDPNRHHWLLECLMEEPPLGESEASFIECGRLYALQGALSQQSWRVSQLFQRLQTRLEDRLFANPFQNVRDRLASLLVMVFDGDLQFSEKSPYQTSPRVQDLIDKVMPKLQSLAEDLPVAETSQEKALSTIVANVTLNNDKSKNSKSEERDGAIRLLKIICKWLIGSISRSQYGALPGFYELFPIVCQLENCETDEELSKTSSGTLAVLAQALTLPRYINVALETVIKVSKNGSWWARATCLEYLQVFVFHNMSIVLSNSMWVNRIRDTVLDLLEDERLEVREKAGQVLGGLLHCNFIPDQESLLEQFKVKAKTRLSKRKNKKITEVAERDRNAEINAIRIRHAGVLGLCAFIRAHPYDVPKYVPSVFEHLGPHLNDPQPIPTTIRKTLGDFKRTHYDGWTGLTGHAQQFTEEQLGILQDLSVPPSYYA